MMMQESSSVIGACAKSSKGRAYLIIASEGGDQKSSLFYSFVKNKTLQRLGQEQRYSVPFSQRSPRAQLISVLLHTANVAIALVIFSLFYSMSGYNMNTAVVYTLLVNLGILVFFCFRPNRKSSNPFPIASIINVNAALKGAYGDISPFERLAAFKREVEYAVMRGEGLDVNSLNFDEPLEAKLHEEFNDNIDNIFVSGISSLSAPAFSLLLGAIVDNLVHLILLKREVDSLVDTIRSMDMDPASNGLVQERLEQASQLEQSTAVLMRTREEIAQKS